jgi:hypothetical protein
MLGHAERSHAEDLADTLNIKADPFCLIFTKKPRRTGRPGLVGDGRTDVV